MVTGRPLSWRFLDDYPGRWPDYRYSPDAHYTLNPSLVRTEDLGLGFPARSERDAQERFWRARKRRVAQMMPGTFSHIGGKDSLRKR
jgi:hypothetical protein